MAVAAARVSIPLSTGSSRFAHVDGSRGACVQRVSQSKRRLNVVATAASATEEKKKIVWADRREVLLKNQIRSVSPEEAAELVKNHGYVILDVRPVGDFEQAHPEGAINVELYRMIQGWTSDKIIRRAAFAFFGVFNGTEENPDFVKEVEAQIPKDAKVIVACMPGGTLKPSPSLPGGKESRSLIAAYILYNAGYKALAHLEGGTYEYLKRDLPAYVAE